MRINREKITEKITKKLTKKLAGKSHDFLLKATIKQVQGIRKTMKFKNDELGVDMCDNVLHAIDKDDDEDFKLTMNLLRKYMATR